MDKIVIVLAPNLRSFCDWQSKERASANPRRAIYADKTERLFGIHANVEIVQLREWFKNPNYTPDFMQQLQRLKSQKFKEVK